jgi:prepilin-type N-terminal cleavage/methylation domain-containing protein
MVRKRPGAFTLIEILIVVVILGVLSAIVVPQFSNATSEAQAMATLDQLVKIREALALYHVRNSAQFPQVVGGAGEAAWGELIGPGYLTGAPKNKWVGEGAADTVVIGVGPDNGWQNVHGWIYDPNTGDLWAGSFDPADQPYPRP